MAKNLSEHSLDIAVISAGPQALTLMAYLLHKRPCFRSRLRVFDPSGVWRGQWQQQFASYEIRHLRSPAVLEYVGNVRSVQFQPNTQLLASVGVDDQVNLWFGANDLAQKLDGAPQGFTCLAWHPGGNQLAAAGEQGELYVWSPFQRGFGRQVVSSK